MTEIWFYCKDVCAVQHLKHETEAFIPVLENACLFQNLNPVRLWMMLNHKFAIFLTLSKQCKNPSKSELKTLAPKERTTGCSLTYDSRDCGTNNTFIPKNISRSIFSVSHGLFQGNGISEKSSSLPVWTFMQNPTFFFTVVQAAKNLWIWKEEL